MQSIMVSVCDVLNQASDSSGISGLSKWKKELPPVTLSIRRRETTVSCSAVR